MTLYFDNDAFRATLVRFKLWIKNPNCETIIIKMVCELFEFVKKWGESSGLESSMLYTQSCTQRAVPCNPFIFWHNILTRIVSQLGFSIQNLNLTSVALMASFLKYVIKIGSCLDNFWWIKKIWAPFCLDCLTNLGLFSKAEPY